MNKEKNEFPSYEELEKMIQHATIIELYSIRKHLGYNTRLDANHIPRIQVKIAIRQHFLLTGSYRNNYEKSKLKSWLI